MNSVIINCIVLLAFLMFTDFAGNGPGRNEGTVHGAVWLENNRTGRGFSSYGLIDELGNVTSHKISLGLTGVHDAIHFWPVGLMFTAQLDTMEPSNSIINYCNPFFYKRQKTAAILGQVIRIHKDDFWLPDIGVMFKYKVEDVNYYMFQYFNSITELIAYKQGGEIKIQYLIGNPAVSRVALDRNLTQKLAI